MFYFYLNYNAVDVEAIFIPSFSLIAIFMGMGIITAFDYIKYLLDTFEKMLAVLSGIY